ncbi:hypothetical protein D9M72_205300 [compost metagenome]
MHETTAIQLAGDHRCPGIHRQPEILALSMDAAYCLLSGGGGGWLRHGCNRLCGAIVDHGVGRFEAGAGQCAERFAGWPCARRAGRRTLCGPVRTQACAHRIGGGLWSVQPRHCVRYIRCRAVLLALPDGYGARCRDSQRDHAAGRVRPRQASGLPGEQHVLRLYAWRRGRWLPGGGHHSRIRMAQRVHRRRNSPPGPCHHFACTAGIDPVHGAARLAGAEDQNGVETAGRSRGSPRVAVHLAG